jgi:dihydrodipicolinate synthase/N-acetylneuraminate lyase
MAPLVSALYADPPMRYYARLKAACQLRGLPVAETLRAPQLEVTDAERDAIRHGLVHAGIAK